MSTTTSLHLGHGEKPPQVRVFTYDESPPLARVELDGGALLLVGRSPADLLLVAEALTDAARQLSDELDKAARSSSEPTA